MKPVTNLQEVYEYKRQIELQKKHLEKSSAFSELEKMNIRECFEYQIGICNQKLTGSKSA